jgi:hypothetical protein
MAIRKRVLVTRGAGQNQFERLRADDPRQLQPDISKAGELCGWDPITILRPGLMKDHHLFPRIQYGARFSAHLGLIAVVDS